MLLFAKICKAASNYNDNDDFSICSESSGCGRLVIVDQEENFEDGCKTACSDLNEMKISKNSDKVFKTDSDKYLNYLKKKDETNNSFSLQGYYPINNEENLIENRSSDDLECSQHLSAFSPGRSRNLSQSNSVSSKFSHGDFYEENFLRGNRKIGTDSLFSGGRPDTPETEHRGLNPFSPGILRSNSVSSEASHGYFYEENFLRGNRKIGTDSLFSGGRPDTPETEHRGLNPFSPGILRSNSVSSEASHGYFYEENFLIGNRRITTDSLFSEGRPDTPENEHRGLNTFSPGRRREASGISSASTIVFDEKLPQNISRITDSFLTSIDEPLTPHYNPYSPIEEKMSLSEPVFFGGIIPSPSSYNFEDSTFCSLLEEVDKPSEEVIELFKDEVYSPVSYVLPESSLSSLIKIEEEVIDENNFTEGETHSLFSQNDPVQSTVINKKRLRSKGSMESLEAPSTSVFKIQNSQCFSSVAGDGSIDLENRYKSIDLESIIPSTSYVPSPLASKGKSIDYRQGLPSTSHTTYSPNPLASKGKSIDYRQGLPSTSHTTYSPSPLASKGKYIDYRQGLPSTSHTTYSPNPLASKGKSIDYRQGLPSTSHTTYSPSPLASKGKNLLTLSPISMLFFNLIKNSQTMVKMVNNRIDKFKVCVRNVNIIDKEVRFNRLIGIVNSYGQPLKNILVEINHFFKNTAQCQELKNLFSFYDDINIISLNAFDNLSIESRAESVKIIKLIEENQDGRNLKSRCEEAFKKAEHGHYNLNELIIKSNK
ncbi:hypothetical protein NGRA_3018 [Nosema granulosis]|uniref:Uncharacterized protein n=1 Tax=Nosema granulosis TaxID=83296 RepID=A0A9P6GVI3_9MICR|nr:hypothetical protein NGRA_3018 [Nosema granulosis]